MTAKYKIRSHDLVKNLTKTLFIVEEMGNQVEMRISAQALLSNKNMLYQFGKKDIAHIAYIAASEETAEDYMSQ